jgi:hypothetical protein
LHFYLSQKKMSKKKKNSKNEEMIEEISIFDKTTEADDLLELGHESNQPCVIARMKTRISNFLQTNLIVQISGHPKILFNCHRCVLQCYSEYFYQLGNVSEVILPADQVTPAIFKSIYEWMLLDDEPQFPVHRYDALVELFTAATFLKIKDLLHQCWIIFDDEDIFHEETAFYFYQKVRQTQHADIKKIMLHRISRFFLTLVASKDYVELNTEEIVQLLQSNCIACSSEVEVLFSAIRWLLYDWVEREQQMLTIIKCIRFGLMTSMQLTYFSQGFDGDHILAGVFNHLSVRQMVEDGLAFVIIKHKHSKNADCFQHFLEQYALNEPNERQWSQDPDRRPIEQPDFENFYEYLQTIQTKGSVRTVKVTHF